MYRLLTPGGEIRVYPTVTLRWEPYPLLDPVLEPIREAGAIVDMRQGRLPFMPKPSPILVVRKPD
ncbi:hypothetical protein ACFQWB_15565 [Paenibacillus thermoaerophilus]|uniref:Uncharacterized protein n=1 Tax=Paenibacillus thermoaerophilus TaxID=1215385 RepID=A0ABW2V9L6_9BACL|nr:hypothetical protein [Paenibacillus thermoaerophilus]TMV17859.1 hypothetical protein FE781_05235 [Paenibacillus thermoaerophilus]